MSPEEIGTTRLVVPSRDALDSPGIVEIDFNGRSKPTLISNGSLSWFNFFEKMVNFYAGISRVYGEENLLDAGKRAPALIELGRMIEHEGLELVNERNGSRRNMIISPKVRVLAYDKIPEGLTRGDDWVKAERYLSTYKDYQIRRDRNNLGLYLLAHDVSDLRKD